MSKEDEIKKFSTQFYTYTSKENPMGFRQFTDHAQNLLEHLENSDLTPEEAVGIMQFSIKVLMGEELDSTDVDPYCVYVEAEKASREV